MASFSQKLYSFSCKFIQLVSIGLAFLLFAGAFLSTCYSLDMVSQQVLLGWDNPLLGLLGMGVFLLFFSCVSKILFRIWNSPAKPLRLLIYCWCVLLGTLLILFGRTVPAADSMSVYSVAEALAAGDTSVIHPTDSYLSYYPQQVGLTAFFEMLIRFWNLLPFQVPAYHFIKCIYVGLACVILYFQERSVHLLREDERTDCLYLLMIGANLPFFMYTSFVYGEIPSFAAASAGLYFLLKLLKNRSGRPMVSFFLALAGLTLGVMLRKNNLILILAVLIVTLLQGLKERRRLLPVFALLCALCCFGILPLVQGCYELRAGNTLSSGVTTSSYFAMGMQEASRGNGWYNGFNFNTYRDTGMDTAATNEISRRAISERLSYFKAHPGYAADFYLKKHLSQWADGTYACRQATLATFGGRSDFFVSLYEGKFSTGFIQYCNFYQNVLYLGVLACFLNLWRESRNGSRKPYLPNYLFLIAVLGGFLFHIIWEANSRYIFLYGLLLIPYGAVGIERILEDVQQKITVRREKTCREKSNF